jgi:murein L,D-transpeptidase YcbB/YkuD
MKKIFSLFLVIILIVRCSNSQDGESGSEAEKASKNVSKRDYSITPASAYSNLFLDSTTMEKFIIEKKIHDSLARRMRSFYNTRNYQFAWFSKDGLTEQARGFWNLHDYEITYGNDSSLNDKALQKKMDNLVMEEDLIVSASDKTYINTELTLTSHFIQYMLKNYEKGYIKRKEMERFIPRKKEDPLRLADSLINKKHKDDKYFEDVNASYKGLKDQLSRYYQIVEQGGWPEITTTKKSLKKGVSAPEIAVIKKRLQVSGDLQGSDSSQVFNDTLENAVKNFQIRHGYTPTGEINTALIKDMNVPAVYRLEQILMNMDRMRWVTSDPSANMIVVNIPEFILHMYEGGKKIFDMVVVVGKEGHNTMMFNGDLNQVVFSPHWNVPPSIVRNEILPAMNKNGNYLASQNMEIVSHEGELPVIRQKPGVKNALGKVKFLFPNSFNIYFHDTPSKSLFEKDKRAFSHGCIRLKEPEKMANYILRNQPEWTPEKITEAMNSGTEKFVKVKNPIPVLITYYTAWADEQGLHFREDIYGHDSRLAKKMFTASKQADSFTLQRSK